MTTYQQEIDWNIVPQTREAPRLAPEPEKVLRNRAVDAHEELRGVILDRLRVALRRIYAQRRAAQGYDLAFVTADDARIIIEADSTIPGPDKLNRNFLGQLFRGETGWEKTGKVINSKTARSHANILWCWRWNESKAKRQAGAA